MSQGPTGPTGVYGIQGTRGLQGPAGVVGITGPTGGQAVPFGNNFYNVASATTIYLDITAFNTITTIKYTPVNTSSATVLLPSIASSSPSDGTWVILLVFNNKTTYNAAVRFGLDGANAGTTLSFTDACGLHVAVYSSAISSWIMGALNVQIAGKL